MSTRQRGVLVVSKSAMPLKKSSSQQTLFASSETVLDSIFQPGVVLIFRLGNAEHSWASLSETLSDVPGQHSTQRRANKRCEISAGPGHFGDGHVHATLAYACGTFLYLASSE